MPRDKISPVPPKATIFFVFASYSTCFPFKVVIVFLFGSSPLVSSNLGKEGNSAPISSFLESHEAKIEMGNKNKINALIKKFLFKNFIIINSFLLVR